MFSFLWECMIIFIKGSLGGFLWAFGIVAFVALIYLTLSAIDSMRN